MPPKRWRGAVCTRCSKILRAGQQLSSTPMYGVVRPSTASRLQSHVLSTAMLKSRLPRDLRSVRRADPDRAAELYRQIPETLRVDTPVTPSTRPEPVEDRIEHDSSYTARAVDGRWSHIEAEADEAAGALERMLQRDARPSSATMGAEGSQAPVTVPAESGSCGEGHAEPSDLETLVQSAGKREPEAEAKYEYQHSFVDPDEALEPGTLPDVKELPVPEAPEAFEDPETAGLGEEREDEDPELSAELDAVWESFFPAQPQGGPVEAHDGDAVQASAAALMEEAEAPPVDVESAEPGHPTEAMLAETAAKGEDLAEAPKVALQAADALKVAREEWLKQFDLGSMDPPPPSPADIEPRLRAVFFSLLLLAAGCWPL